MDRIAALTTQAVALRRQLYASLPWGLRLAHIFFKIALDTVETFGRTVGAFLLRFGVEGLPDPGPGWNPKVKGPERTLPSSYLRPWASALYGSLLRKYRDPSFVEDVLVSLMLKLVNGQIHIDLSQDGKACLSYLTTAAMMEASKLLKLKADKQRRNEDSYHTEDPEGESREVEFVNDKFEDNPYWLENPHQFKSIERMVNPSEWRKVLDTAGRMVGVSPEDLHIYFDALADGTPVKSIFDEGKLKHYSKGYANWKATVEPKLFKAVKGLITDLVD